MTALLSFPRVISQRLSRSLITVTKNLFSCSSAMLPLILPIAQQSVLSACQLPSFPDDCIEKKMSVRKKNTQLVLYGISFHLRNSNSNAKWILSNLEPFAELMGRDYACAQTTCKGIFERPSSDFDVTIAPILIHSRYSVRMQHADTICSGSQDSAFQDLTRDTKALTLSIETRHPFVSYKMYMLCDVLCENDQGMRYLINLWYRIWTVPEDEVLRAFAPPCPHGPNDWDRQEFHALSCILPMCRCLSWSLWLYFRSHLRPQSPAIIMWDLSKLGRSKLNQQIQNLLEFLIGHGDTRCTNRHD